ncbi:MAG: DUF116 domain-containing protein [Deltaproteobacteria bacterium]|jgi:hypothetical protein|nr:DUF116 domain-containing protein [Deltaproteobacteria bacterium]
MKEKDTDKPRKRLFIGLICATSALLCLVLILGWGIPYVGLNNIHPAAPYITGFVLALFILVIAWSSLALVLQVITGRALWGTGEARCVAVRLFLPLMEFCGRAVGITPAEVRRSFIQVNNQLVRQTTPPQAPEKLLLLLPHCIQWSGCKLRVSNSVERCERCGRCDIAALLDLAEKYGVHMAIATGGTIARRIVVEKRPRLILAVACERDLASGIQDTFPLPVFGLLNERPFGPCVDTRVDLERLENALRGFIQKESPEGQNPSGQ